MIARILNWGAGAGIAIFMILCLSAAEGNHWTATTGAIACLSLVVILSCLGLWGVIFDAFSSVKFMSSGIRRSLLNQCQLIPWSDVAAINLATGTFNIGGWKRKLRMPKAPEVHLILRLWRSGVRGSGRRRIPLFLQSSVGKGAWLWVGFVLLFTGPLFFIAGSRASVSIIHVMVGVGIVCMGLCCIAVALHLMTEKVVLLREGIYRKSIIVQRQLRWDDIDMLLLKLDVQDMPFHGTAVMTAGHSKIQFKTRATRFPALARYIKLSCRKAFFIDDRTGYISPPAVRNLAQIQFRFYSLATQLRRRYRVIGIFQIIGLPFLWILWLMAGFGHVWFFNCMPYRVSHIRDNFRKAQTAMKSWYVFQSELRQGVPLPASGK